MTVLAWILLGLIAGVVANAIDPNPSQGGVLGAIVLGIVGALAGGFLSDLLFGIGVTGFNFSSVLVAVGGSLILLWVGRALSRA